MKEIDKLEIVAFRSIDSPDLPDEVVKDLSRDQHLLYLYTKAIATGQVSKRLAAQVAGPLNHSRWITLALRAQQLYTRTTTPSVGLITIVTFIQAVYSPSWFRIKSHVKFTSSPSNLHYQMELVINQPQEIQDIVKPVIQRNAYFADPSLILCGMMESENDSVRRMAVDKIQAARSKPPKPPRARVCKGIRKHVIPPLVWDSKNWWDMINWNNVKLYEPKIIKNLSDELINSILNKPISFPEFPCHSQSVERSVNLVILASDKVCGQDRRHGFILGVNKNRQKQKTI